MSKGLGEGRVSKRTMTSQCIIYKVCSGQISAVAAMGIVHSPNMHNMYVALLVLCCSLGILEVSAVKFEEFLGYPFGELYGYSAFPPSVDRVRGVTIPTPFTFFGQIYNFANVSSSNHSANKS